MNRNAMLKVVEAALLEEAADRFDYACFHLHRAQGERPFFSVSLHAGNECRSGNGPSIYEALMQAFVKKPFIYSEEKAA